MREMVTVREIPIGAAVTIDHDGPMMHFRGGVDYGHGTHLMYLLDSFEYDGEGATVYLNPTVDRAIVMEGWYSIIRGE